MDRLLTEQEALEASLRDKENGLDIITIYLKAQDAKTASLVATQIFKDLEEPCPHEKGTLKADCRFCYQAIKSRHGEKE